jgi:hypothetical protein
MELLFLWLIVAGATAIVASNRNRNVFGWFVLGFFFSFIALIVVACLDKVENKVQ